MRADVSYKGNRLSITYFRERMNNAFDDITYYRSLAYKLYDPASIDGSALTAPPELSQLTYTNEYNLDVYSTQGNVMKVCKEGVEFQFASKRIESLKTRVTMYGAYIQRLGLTFSTSAQCTWYTNRRNLWNNGVPVSYIDQSGETHPFREEDKNNIQLQHLVEKYSATYFERTTVPFYMDINLKASKRIGKYLNLAFYVNRLLGIYPDYTLRGVLQRRTSESPYFGMEMNLTF